MGSLDLKTEPMRIAILLPCYNEAAAIDGVVREFRAVLPTATIYVYDNDSSDDTMAVARAAGAVVRGEPLRGKGNVVRRMFADIEADIYVMADGDGTYHAPSAIPMIRRLVEDNLDMVVGTRLHSEVDGAFRAGHQFGNRMLTGFVGWLFGNRFQDMLSGYRVFSRRFVKSFPALSQGFEIETELAVHALELRMPVAEVSTPYGARPEGSQSKLRTYRDGFRILMTILMLFKEERPLGFFSLVFAALFGLASLLGGPLVVEWLDTGLVPRFPTAILATGVMILAFLSLSSGFVLDTVTLGRREMKRMAYLSIPGPSPAPQPAEAASVDPALV
ncbi:MAG: glycosyltransferase [Alphaproteobacteria bacterium]|nr:glycosyltransferase [Alphaproteobacteria bacterium]